MGPLHPGFGLCRCRSRAHQQRPPARTWPPGDHSRFLAPSQYNGVLLPRMQDAGAAGQEVSGHGVCGAGQGAAPFTFLIQWQHSGCIKSVFEAFLLETVVPF